MQEPKSSVGRISGAAPEQQYGEGVQIAEQQAGAPMLGQGQPPSLAAAPVPGAAPASAALPDNLMPKGGNVVGVLPPLNTAPSSSGIGRMPPQQQVAYAIFNLPGVSGMAKSLASQLIQSRSVPFDYGEPQIVPTEEAPPNPEV